MSIYDFPSDIVLNQTALPMTRIKQREREREEIYVSIPHGVPSLVWFTLDADSNSVCLICDAKANETKKWSLCLASFDDSLCFGSCGTILRGVVFSCKNNNKQGNKQGNKQSKDECDGPYFSIENVLYYKGENMATQKMETQLSTLIGMFSSNEILWDVDGQRQINQCLARQKEKRKGKRETNSPMMMMFGLPIMATSLEQLRYKMTGIPYAIREVHVYDLQSNGSLFTQVTTTTHPFSVAENNDAIKAWPVVADDTKSDIYHLANYPDKNLHIRNCEASRKMKELFSTLNEIVVECKWNRRFQCWEPVVELLFSYKAKKKEKEKELCMKEPIGEIVRKRGIPPSLAQFHKSTKAAKGETLVVRWRNHQEHGQEIQRNKHQEKQ